MEQQGQTSGNSKTKKFLKGTLILTISSIVVKVIGALNWVILSRVMGGEGIGLYQMGFPIYLMAITVSSLYADAACIPAHLPILIQSYPLRERLSRPSGSGQPFHRVTLILISAAYI